jgi:flavin reductase
MSDLRQDFIDGMAQAAATVTIVATDGLAGKAGVTVSAMSSVSADTEKPTLLVCVNDSTSAARRIIKNGVFSVNLLSDNQMKVSEIFAGRFGHGEEEKFAATNWSSGASGAPLLGGALASFDCKLVGDHIVGTHHVFFGEVEQVGRSGHGRALVYASRSYRTISSNPPTVNEGKET